MARYNIWWILKTILSSNVLVFIYPRSNMFRNLLSSLININLLWTKSSSIVRINENAVETKVETKSPRFMSQLSLKSNPGGSGRKRIRIYVLPTVSETELKRKCNQEWKWRDRSWVCLVQAPWGWVYQAAPEQIRTRLQIMEGLMKAQSTITSRRAKVYKINGKKCDKMQPSMARGQICLH